MKVEIGTKAAQCIFWEYLKGIFAAVWSVSEKAASILENRETLRKGFWRNNLWHHLVNMINRKLSLQFLKKNALEKAGTLPPTLPFNQELMSNLVSRRV